jgi:hypothetical protein
VSFPLGRYLRCEPKFANDGRSGSFEIGRFPPKCSGGFECDCESTSRAVSGVLPQIRQLPDRRRFFKGSNHREHTAYVVGSTLYGRLCSADRMCKPGKPDARSIASPGPRNFGSRGIGSNSHAVSETISHRKHCSSSRGRIAWLKRGICDSGRFGRLCGQVHDTRTGNTYRWLGTVVYSRGFNFHGLGLRLYSRAYIASRYRSVSPR